MNRLDSKTKLRHYVRLMHFPLPLCVLSFTTLGALLAPSVNFTRLAWTYLIVFASLCLASYSFDELKGRPLHTKIPENELRILGWIGLLLSLAGGLYLAITINLLLLIWIPPSALIIVGYNRELFHGRLHNRAVFALGWGGIPTLGSYFLQTLTFSIPIIIVSFATMMFSLAVWTLNHEFRSDFNMFQDVTVKLNGDIVAARRQARRRIWTINKILCYMITLFTIAFFYYRFFP